MIHFSSTSKVHAAIDRIKSVFVADREHVFRRVHRRSRSITTTESLETRALLAVTPVVAISAPSDAFIGSSVNLTVSFDNGGSGSETGYGPIIDVVLPVNGTDGGASPDGLNTTGPATYLGMPITTIELTFPNGGGGTGSVNHPFFKDSSGNPLVVTGNTGDKLVVMQLPFGSFTPDQPAAAVNLPLTMSNLADLNAPLTIRSRSGFQYGIDPLDNPGSDPSLVSDSPSNSSTWSVSQAVNPILTRLTKQNLAPESETATGPNFPRQYQIVVEVAQGQTITNFDVSDLLPPEIVYLGNGSLNVSPSLSPVIISSPLTSGPQNTPNNDLTVRIPTVTGGAGNTGFTLTFGYYVNQFNASSAPVINAASADDTQTLNSAIAIGDWTPIDSRDAGAVNNAVARETIAGPDDVLENKAIAVQKSVAIVTDMGGSGATPGDVLEYTLEFQVSDYFAFNNIVLNDLLSDGQRIDDSFTPRMFIQEHGDTSVLSAINGANFTIADNFTGLTDTGNAAGTGPSHVVDGSVAAGSQQARFRISDELMTRGGGLADGQLVGGAIPNGGTGGPDPASAAPLPFSGTIGRIVYRAIIQDDFSDEFPSGDRSVDVGDTLTNSAVISGNVLNVTNLIPNGNTENDNTAASIDIARGSLLKQVYAINGNTSFASPIHVAPGDTVTYRLLFDLPTSDIEGLGFVDYLPLPVFASTEVGGAFNTTVSAAVPAAGTAKFGPSDTFYSNSVAVLGGLGLVPTITTDSAANSLTFDYGDFDDPANSSTQIDILFTVTVSDDPFADGLFLTNQVRQVETSTNAGDSFNDAIVQIGLGEPELNIRKGVVGSNSSGTFSPTTVGPVVFSAPGAGDNNAATPEFAGTINSTNLAATPINSNLSGVDAGDVVKFAIVVENTGSSRLGAFDVALRDTMPIGFAIPGSGLNLSITDGTGATLTFTDLGGGLFGSGYQLNDPGATPATGDGSNGGAVDAFNATSGRNVVIVTYDLVLTNSVAPNAGLTNTATLLSYAGAEGALNHIPGGLTDTATVTVASPIVDKVITTTNQLHTSGNNVAIGEIVTYTVTVTVPEGQSASTRLVDTLDAGLGFVDIVSITPSSGALAASAGTFAAITTATTFGAVGAGSTNAGRLMTVDFGTLTNSDTDNSTDETITIVYRAAVLNTATNIRGAGRNNSAAWTWTGGSVVDAAPNVVIVEPTLDVVKTMSPTSADAGDTVTITLVLQHAASSNANAFEVNLQDILPAGLNYVAASLSHTGGLAPTTGPTESSGTITAGWTLFPLGSTSTLTLQATLTGAVIPGSTITNTATTAWTGLPADVTTSQSTFNTLAVERTGNTGNPGGAANTYVDSGIATLNITTPAPVKSIVATSEAHTSDGSSTAIDPTRVAVGEIIRYRLQTTLPEGTSPNLRLIDILPNGLSIHDLSQIRVSFTADSDLTEAGDLSGADNDAVAPTFLLPAGRVSSLGQTTTFDLGTLVNNDSDAGIEFITLEFNVLVTNAVVNQNPLQHSNNFVVQVNGTNVATSNSVVSQIVEPVITNVTKSVTSFATGSVTYRVTYSNTGTATAFDVRMQDILPSPALTLNVASVSVTPAGGAAGVTDVSTGNTVDVVLASIPVGGSVTITYTASVNSATQSVAIPNTAAVTYTSLPGGGTTVNATGSSTPVNGERTGADGPGGALNDYANNGSASLGALGDRVWFDVDADGTQDGGEPGIGGVTMTLTWFGPNGTLGGGDDVIVTRVTAADGSYQFVGLPAGNYRVVSNTADLPAGMAQTFDASGSQSDSTSLRTLTGGQIATDQDFGYRGTGSIGDTVWYDIDSSGTQNGTEPGIPGVTVTLNIDFDRNGSTDVVLTRITDQNGNYSFPNLPFADYTVVTTQPGGTVQTFDASGAQNDNSSALTLPGGANNTAQDFGYVGTGSVGDRVWYDQDTDGVQDAAEPGFANITVALDIDFNQDGTVDHTTTTTTDINGNYLFPNLPVGSYTVRIPTVPSGTVQTFDADGTATVNQSSLVLGASQNNLAQDFGFTGTGSIGDRVWFDQDQDAAPTIGEPGFVGVPVALDIDLNGDSIVDMTLNTVTGANGVYLFSSLPAGNYTVRVTRPAGTDQTYDASGSQVDDRSALVLAAGANNLLQDFGYFGRGSIGDTVFFDINGDGIMNGQDVGIPGVAVQLSGDLDGDGTADYTSNMITDAAGQYRFPALPPGTYTVTVTQPAGTVQTYDANGPLNNQSLHVLAVDENNVLQDFGYRGTGSIGDRVWFDADGDDVQDGGEPGFVGVPVALDVDLNGDGTAEVTLVTTTGANGVYSFGNLPAGTYTVRVTPPAGTSQTFDASGSQSDSTSNLLLAAGANNTAQDFGYRGTGSIGDRVWFDANSDGVQDGVETGIPNVPITLQLDLNGDSVTDYTTSQNTTGSGSYLFSNLPPGNYTITATQPPATAQTYDASGSQVDNRSSLTLAAGQNNLLQDFGYVGVGTGTIGDFVWLDRNGNGIQDVGEPGLANVTVTLELDVNTDGTPDYTQSMTTDNTGHYLFNLLIPGLYTIIVTPPANLTQTGDPDATLNNRSQLTLAAGVNNLTQDFGYQGTGVIGDRVYRDENGSGTEDAGDTGINAAIVNLSGDIDGDGIAEIFTTPTNSAGNYSFTGLPVTTPTGGAIVYTVAVNPASLPVTVTPFVDPDGTADHQSNVTLTAASPINNTLDFGYVELVDLAITKTNTDPMNTRLPNEPVTYRIVVTNAGPGPAVNAHVVDNFPAHVVSSVWTATGSAGTSFSATGSGNMNDTVFIPVNGTITYTVTTTLNGTFLGDLTNTASVTTIQLDTDPLNNSSTNVTRISPIVVTTLTPPIAGQPVTFRARGQGLHTAIVPFAVGTSLGTTVVNGVTLGIANATVFGVGVQCSGGAVEATYTLPASFAGQTIYIQAFETQPVRLASNVLAVTVGAAAPLLTGPIGATQAARPTFTWSGTAGAVSYEIWIESLATGVNPYMRQTVTGTTFTPSSDMAIGRYQVWVQGIRANGTRTAWSPSIITEINTRVQLITLNSTTSSQQPTITWNALSGATRYDIWFDNATTGTNQVVRNTNVLATSFTPAAPLNFGAYRVWVRGLDLTGNPGDWSNPLQMNIGPAPVPTGPAAVTVDATPTFTWNAVPGANRYDLWVNNLTTQVSQVIRQSALAAAAYTPTANLPRGQYQWWVRAISTSVTGPVTGSWSVGQIFTLGGAPVLLTPGASTSDTTPTFSWTAVAGAASYEIWVDRVGIQSAIISQTGIAGTSFTGVTALPVGNYRVWLRAIGTDGTIGNWGSAFNFTIAASDVKSEEILSPELDMQQVLDTLDQEVLALVTRPVSIHGDRELRIEERYNRGTDPRTFGPEKSDAIPIPTSSKVHSTLVMPRDLRSAQTSGHSIIEDIDSLDYILAHAEDPAWDV